MLRHLMTSWHLHISNVKLDYLKNEKSFRNQIKVFFLVSQVLSFRHTKQTSKNEAEATFKFLQVVLRVCCFRTNSSVSKDVMWIQPFRLSFLFGSDTWRKKTKLVVNKSILLKVLWKFLWDFLRHPWRSLIICSIADVWLKTWNDVKITAIELLHLYFSKTLLKL